VAGQPQRHTGPRSDLVKPADQGLLAPAAWARQAAPAT
jgi:hypothetical protein